MKPAALALAAVAVLGLAANASWAGDRAFSYPMAAHVAATHSIHHASHNQVIHQVHHRYPAYRHYRHPRGPVVVRPPVPRRPVVVVPRYVAPRVYPAPRYYAPRGVTYYGPGFSIGFGF